jgi:3-phosphoshikimate 1-carboxyvinyltransferase
MRIHGGTPLKGAHVQSFGDHRIAMACAILGLFAEGQTVIEDVDCIATSYPSFEKDLKKLSSKSAPRLQVWQPKKSSA